MATAAVMAAAAAAQMAGTAITAEQQRKQNRKARLLQEAQMMDTRANQQKALGRSQLLNQPVFTQSDVNRMQSAYTDSVYGGYNQGIRAIQDSLAARGLSKSGLTDEQLFNYNLQTAMANAQGVNQLLTQTAAQNRGALENYVRMANAATLGYEPQLQQQTQNLQGIAMTDPRIGLGQSIGNTASQGLGWYAGQKEKTDQFNALMGQLKSQNTGNNAQYDILAKSFRDQTLGQMYNPQLGSSAVGSNKAPSGQFNKGTQYDILAKSFMNQNQGLFNNQQFGPQ